MVITHAYANFHRKLTIYLEEKRQNKRLKKGCLHVCNESLSSASDDSAKSIIVSSVFKFDVFWLIRARHTLPEEYNVRNKKYGIRLIKISIYHKPCFMFRLMLIFVKKLSRCWSRNILTKSALTYLKYPLKNTHKIPIHDRRHSLRKGGAVV